MKFSVNRSELFAGLQKVQSVVEKKNTVQILGNILCQVEKNKLSLYGTDLEVGVKVVLPVESQSEGALTLSAKHFVEIVKELTNETLHISKKSNDWVEIICGKFKSNVVSLPADEFPQLPQFEEKKYFKARSTTLCNMIDKSAFAVSTDATRYHLNGVFFEPTDNHMMKMTATDGHRLSVVEEEVFEGTVDLKRGIIIPRKGLTELRNLLGLSSDSVMVAFERGYLFANFNETHLFVRLIEGEYPDCKQLIPQFKDHKVNFNREALLAVVRHVSLLANEKSKGIKFSFSPNLLTVHSSNPDMGEAREEIEVDYAGENLELGFNARYLLDALPTFDSEIVSFTFKDKLNPGMVRAGEKENHTYVIMPMRI